MSKQSVMNRILPLGALTVGINLLSLIEINAGSYMINMAISHFFPPLALMLINVLIGKFRKEGVSDDAVLSTFEMAKLQLSYKSSYLIFLFFIVLFCLKVYHVSQKNKLE